MFTWTCPKCRRICHRSVAVCPVCGVEPAIFTEEGE